VRFEDYMGTHDGGVHIIYGTGNGLRAAGNQFWSQDSPGILDRAASNEHFGWSLTGGWSNSGNPGEARPDYWARGKGIDSSALFPTTDAPAGTEIGPETLP
ncbi:MAG: hypothetical protein M3452_03615, partial [Chloroflexota bacterium]|nr:hypothetical protein [Chloroflexota bacterium]